jgi:hypothetical protein
MPDDDEFDTIPVRRPPDPDTPSGRIQGIHKRKYARLWGVALDIVDGDYNGQDDFDVTYKLMWSDHARAEGLWGDNTRREIDLEEFALAWRPPTESEMIDEIIAERIAEERAAREPDPEARH